MCSHPSGNMSSKSRIDLDGPRGTHIIHNLSLSIITTIIIIIDRTVLSFSPTMENPHITDHRAAIRAEIESELDGCCRFGEKVKEEIERELCDPELELFHNIQSLSIDEWERFDIHHGVLPLENDTDSNDGDDEHDGDEGGGSNKRRKKLKVQSPVAYHYHIGRYKKSAWYKSFLSDDKLLSRARRYGSFIAIRELTDRMSRNSKSAFRAWF